MDQTTFEQIMNSISSAGFVIETVENHESNGFGSWYLVIRAEPRHRIVWDGKDGWLLIEREIGPAMQGFAEWDTVWIGRDSREQSPTHVIAKLTESTRDAHKPDVRSTK
jgi:hypothetical protein